MTETTIVVTKEDNITPVEHEKKSDVNVESKPEGVTPEGEVSDSKTEEKKEEVKEIKPIESGYLHKYSKILLVKHHWTKSYFAFGSQAVLLSNLKTYHKKNVKKNPPATTKVPGHVNATSTIEVPAEVEVIAEPKVEEVIDEVVDESSKVVVESTSSSDIVEEVKETKDGEDKKPEIKEINEADDKKPVDDKKPSDTKDDDVSPYLSNIYKNIAHASQTGEGLLFYYKSDSDSHKIVPHGIINLKDVNSVVSIDDFAGKQFIFKIETSYRTFELAADKVEDRDSWIKTINERVEKAKNSSEASVESDEYKETYEKLCKGTAFSHEASKAGELSDEVFSGDEEVEKPRSADASRRKSYLPFSFRKPSTTETSTTVTETNDEGGKTVTTTTITTTTTAADNTNTEETEEIKSGESKSPQRSSKFLSFFNKKSETTPVDDDKVDKIDKDDKGKIPEETTNAENSTSAVNSSAVTNGSVETTEGEKWKFSFFKKSSGKENQTAENKEVVSNTEQNEQTEQIKAESAETPAEETHQHKEGSFLKFFKSKSTGETSETKAESTDPSAEVTTTEVKSDEKKEVEEKEGKKKKKKDEQNAATSSDSSSDTSSDTEDKDKSEPSLVRRVTTKIFGPRRGKKNDRDLSDKETEEKKEVVETSETNPTENADATEQAAEQTTEQTTGPESSTETENKKNRLFNFGRRKSGGGNKKENSESQGETEMTATTEATEVENTSNVEKEKETENAVQNPVIPDGIKKGELHKQAGVFKTYEQRYFVLTSEKKLYYYKSINDASNQKSIDLVKVKIGDGTKFDLETKSRTYYLKASSKEERDEWIKAFKGLGFTVADHEKESTSENREAKIPAVVAESGNENDIQQSVEDAADKVADTADATVSETQETVTKSANVEETEKTTITETTETTETIEKTETTTEETTTTTS